jgi:hypothetical protein
MHDILILTEPVELGNAKINLNARYLNFTVPVELEWMLKSQPMHDIYLTVQEETNQNIQYLSLTVSSGVGGNAKITIKCMIS